MFVDHDHPADMKGGSVPVGDYQVDELLRKFLIGECNITQRGSQTAGYSYRIAPIKSISPLDQPLSVTNSNPESVNALGLRLCGQAGISMNGDLAKLFADEKETVSVVPGMTARDGLDLISRTTHRPWRLLSTDAKPSGKSADGDEKDAIISHAILSFGVKKLPLGH